MDDLLTDPNLLHTTDPNLLHTTDPNLLHTTDPNLLHTTDPNLLHKRKYTLLPVLVILFLISYGLLARLVVEQDRIVSFQLTLIKQLLGDSKELSALKGKIQRDQKQAQNHSQAPSPHPQAPRKSQPKSHHGTPRPKLLPEKPPIPASDAMDERRAQIKI